jgi:1,4-alpha-glucan branching enzyme
VGYFAATSRFGRPEDFMFFVDTLHQAGLGVILDWAPAHFPSDEHGLSYFDGTHLFEHSDPRQRTHPHWGSLVFNYDRNEVSNFLISSALFWFDKYHIDGLRVDAVASMLYLDYGRDGDDWVPNVHGKGSLINKMPGDDWQKFANLSLLYAYMFGHPGKKLLFMGCEFGQRDEWDHDNSLDWHLTQYPPHEGLQKCVADLNRIYQSEPALHRRDFDAGGFEWIDCSDRGAAVVSFIRKAGETDAPLVVVCNFTPVPRQGYRVGVPLTGHWEEVYNSDSTAYAGSGVANPGAIYAEETPWHGRDQSLKLELPPLAAIYLKPVPKNPR